MDWWNAIGNMYALTSTPGLAYDMAVNGPDPDRIGYGLAYGLQKSSAQIDLYPPDDCPMFDQTGEQRKIFGEILEQRRQITLQRPHLAGRRIVGRRLRVAPFGELPRDRLLDCLTEREIGCAACAGADEIALVQGQARRQLRHFNHSASAFRGRSADTQPLPTAPDHFAQRADRQAVLLVGKRPLIPNEITQRRRLPLAHEANLQNRALRRWMYALLDAPPVDRDRNALWVMKREKFSKCGIEQRLKMAAQHFFEKTGIEQR
jgi:hypothetical protein